LGFSFIALAVVQIVVTISQTLWLRWALNKKITIPIHIHFTKYNKSFLTLLFGYSLFMFVMIISRQVITSAGPAIVGRFVNVEAVTTYSVGNKLGLMIQQFSLPVAAALLPAFSSLDALKDQKRLKRLYIESLRIAALVAFPIASMSLVLVKPIIALWIGPQYLSSAPIALVMIIQAVITTFLITVSSMLNGVGKLRLNAYLHIFAIAFSILFAILLTPRWGIVMVALGSMLAWGSVLIVLLPYSTHVSGVPIRQLNKYAFLRPFIATTIACLVLYALEFFLYPENWFILLSEMIVFSGIYLILVWYICLGKDQRQNYWSFLRSKINTLLSVPAQG